jgi:hypothetical protein
LLDTATVPFPVADRTGIQGASDPQGPQSLFGYNQIPSKVEASAKAWFYGKLLSAAFCETWANKARFSPSADRFVR